MVPAKQVGRTPEHEEEQICPLCINELDDTERAWLPCSCGYQLCLFCYDRLKTEFSNRCPNCRVEYDSDFQAGLRRRQERVAQLQRECEAAREADAKAAAAAVAAERAGGGRHVQPPPPPPPRVVRSPLRDLRIEQEGLWPSLGAPPQAQQQHQQAQAQHTPPGQRAQPEASALRQSPQLAAILPQPAEQEASSSSSADTAATTPQSPVCSVVGFRAAPPPGAAGKPAALSVLLAAPLHGRCLVVLQRGGGLGVEPDPEGASLAASLQESVRAGTLSVKQAAAALASHLRQCQRQQAAGSAGSSPACAAASQPGSASSSAPPPTALSPFSLPPGGLEASLSGASTRLLGQGSLGLCDSGVSAATSASLSHWAPGSTASSLPLAAPPPALFASSTWQQPAGLAVGSPVRDGDRLPLFLRRGSLPAAAAAAAAQSVGSPGSKGSSGSSAASFPGFPSGSSSPTQELKRMIVPPPGLGPTLLGSTGIAALPRFR